MKTKIAIGCLVQWYEAEIIGEYIESLKDAVKSYDGTVTIDFHVNTNQDLEQAVSADKLSYCIDKINTAISSMNQPNTFYMDNRLITIADYRRHFNEKYCDSVDVLMWGESDSLIPKQTFVILDQLHNKSLQNNNPKYLAFFGGCKMWDESWKQLEHPDFTDKPFIEGDTKNWWSLRYTMNKSEMDEINDKTEDLDVQVVSPHKFNGCGLVISSEVIRAGVNIPKSIFFIHEDSAFMWMTNKVLGDIPQYIIKNILLVHNRKSPKKREHIAGEVGIDKTDLGAQRKTHDWYMVANSMCEQNYQNLFNPNYKSFTWNDVFNT